MCALLFSFHTYDDQNCELSTLFFLLIYFQSYTLWLYAEMQTHDMFVGGSRLKMTDYSKWRRVICSEYIDIVKAIDKR